MADKPVNVQCYESSKQVFERATITLGWTYPEVLALAADAVARMVEDEESEDDRRRRLLAKLGSGDTPPRRSVTTPRRGITPIPQDSHIGEQPVEQAS